MLSPGCLEGSCSFRANPCLWLKYRIEWVHRLFSPIVCSERGAVLCLALVNGAAGNVCARVSLCVRDSMSPESIPGSGIAGSRGRFFQTVFQSEFLLAVYEGSCLSTSSPALSCDLFFFSLLKHCLTFSPSHLIG